MERTSSKRGLLMETTSYDQDLSSHSNPLASASAHSALHAVSSAPLEETSQHPLASIQQPQICGPSESYMTTSMTTSRHQMEATMSKDQIILPPPISLPGPLPQYHINLSDTDALLKRAQEMGLLDPLNTTALPQIQRLLAANLSNKLHGDPTQQQIQQIQHPLLQLPNSQHRFSLEEKSVNPIHQYNLSTINERTSPNGSPADGYGVEPQNISASSAYNRESSRPSTSSAVNGFGSGVGGITSLTGPGTVQQVIGALQSSQQQQEQHRRRVHFLKPSITYYLDSL